MMSGLSVPYPGSVTMASGSRPRLGLACEECRRRKSKCDREWPCGLCLEFRVECVFEDNRSKRGPKKGQLGALKARIGKFAT